MTKTINDFLYEKVSYEIRGACFEVWKHFKGMFKESIVDKALTIAMEKRNLKVESQKRINIYFDGKVVGTYIPDKIVKEKILIEFKIQSIYHQTGYRTILELFKGFSV